MDFLKQLDINNFQVYSHATITFDPHVTLLTGTSGHGKSSVIRAIKWLVFNRPVGTSFCRFDTTKTSVTGTFASTKITRFRTASKNQYLIPDSDICLKALRTNVPTAISNIHNLASHNLQTQKPKDTYFLLDESPGAIAKKLNDLVGLSIINTALKKVQDEIRTNTQTRKVYISKLNEYQQQIESFTWLPLADKKFKQIETAQRKNTLRLQHIQSTQQQIKTIKQLQFKLDSFIPDYLVLEAKKILNLHTQRIELKNQISYIQSLIDKLKRLQNKANSITVIPVESLSKQVKHYTELQNIISQISKTVHTIKSLQHNFKIISDRLKQTKIQHKELLHTTGTCPLCKTKL
jgi:exonuclease SbcC